MAAPMVYHALTGGAIDAPPMESVARMVSQGRGRMISHLNERAARPQDLPFPLQSSL